MSEFLTPRRIVSGENALDSAIKYIVPLGKKALIVTGKIVVTLDIFKHLTDLLDENGVKYEIFTGITGEPTDVMINEGVEAYKNAGCDFLIGIGGGSPLDSMKAIGALITNGGKIPDYMGKIIEKPLPPMAAVPTTAGTGSEATQFTVITDSEKDIKMLLKGTVLIPDVAVIDGALTKSSPKGITASTALDALTHAVEAYTSKKAQPLTDPYCIAAVQKIFKYLPRAYENGEDIEARNELAIAALEAGICINNSSVTIVHGMSRPIGALFHVSHGTSNAMLLEKCMAFAVDGAYDKFAVLGRAIGVAENSESDKDAADKFIIALGDICKKCEIPSLAEYGIDKDKFFELMDKMATDALASGSPSNTIKDVTKEDVLELYKALW